MSIVMTTKTINERSKSLVDAVKLLSEMENEELFKMIYKDNSVYTRNNNGIFINLAWISEELLEKLELYVEFCNASHSEIQKYESIRHVLNSKLNLNQTKVKVPKIENVVVEPKEEPEVDNSFEDNTNELLDKSGNKISPSMKFSLLKKKFSKQYNINMNNQYNQFTQNELYHDKYLIA